MTLVRPEILDGLGYSAREGIRRSTVTAVTGDEPGYIQLASRFEVFGVDFASIPIHAHDLPEQYEIDGLLGLDILRHFRIMLDCSTGRLDAEPSALPS